MLKDIVKKYYTQGYNCAESIVRGANEYYNLGIDESGLKLAAAFGAGMQIGDTCGGLTGAACVVSSKIVETKAHDTELLPVTMQRVVKAFQDHFGDTSCRVIRPQKFNPEIRCLGTVMESADVLESVLGTPKKSV